MTSLGGRYKHDMGNIVTNFMQLLTPVAIG
jgi:hypothetical protein